MTDEDRKAAKGSRQRQSITDLTKKLRAMIRAARRLIHRDRIVIASKILCDDDACGA